MKKIRINNLKNSSALILTLVIVTIIAGMIFFVSRSAIKEQELSGSTNASMAAYYAAEAGIEDGLARLAADKNIETPDCLADGQATCTKNSNLSVEDLALATPLSFPERIRMARFGANAALSNNATDTDLTASINPLDINGNLTKPESNEYVYDLKITSRVSSIGKTTSGDNPVPVSPCEGSPCTASDEGYVSSGNVKEITLDTGVGDGVPTDMQIYFSCTGQTSCTAQDKLLVEYIRTGCSTTVECTEDHVMDYRSSDGSIQLENFGTSQATGNIVKVRIKPVSSNSSFSGVNISLVAKKTVNGVTTAVKMKSDVTTVQSIGYYGGVTRRLEAQVDRSSGALLGLFDYAVYAGTTLTQP